MHPTGQQLSTHESAPQTFDVPVAPAFFSGLVLGVMVVGAVFTLHGRHREHLQTAGRTLSQRRGLNLSGTGTADAMPQAQPGPARQVAGEESFPQAEQAGNAVAPISQATEMMPRPAGRALEPAIQPLVAATAPYEHRKQTLWQAMRRDAPWLLQLLERTPVLIWGPQQSGKSTLSKVIAMIRKLFLGHKIVVSDPQASRNIWPGCFTVVGDDRNFREVGLALQRYYGRIANQQPVPTTSLWDEFTSYEGWVPETFKGYAEGFVKSVLAESQAGNEFPILLSHGRTSGYLGGSKGTKETRAKGLVEIEAIPAYTETGRAYGSGRYTLDVLSPGPDEPRTMEVHLPNWLRGEALMQMFPELETKECDFTPTDLNNPQAYQRFVDEANPEDIDQLIAEQRRHQDNGLPTELATILDYALGKDWLQPSDISANRQEFRKVPSAVIQAYFRELFTLSLGEISEVGGTLLFRAFKTASDDGETP